MSGVPSGASVSNNSGLRFHRRCGQLVTLSECGRTATRSKAAQEFNHGLVMSAEPLQDNQLFEVRVDKKISAWSGSIEIGVISCDPGTLESPFPSSATELRQGSWIMSGNSVLKDGRSINENYGTDLDKLEEGDRVGVVKTSNGDLIFFVNGVSQSVAAHNLPEKIYAVVDMYGKCAQITLMDNTMQEVRILNNALTNEATAAAQQAQSHAELQVSHNDITNSTIAAMSTSNSSNSLSRNRQSSISLGGSKIRFHDRKGALIKLSNNNRTAERRKPFDEFNNGVVMTHRPLKDNELFEIRIDRLVDKWSGSIEIGITTHNPNEMEFPNTMTNAKSGTMMMSGRGILTNGRGTRREYGDFNLDELSEGDRIGMIRKANGNLHFYINGLDQGVAATKVPQQMWGVVDLYGMAVKVTIVDRDERDEQNLITRRNVAAAGGMSLEVQQEDLSDKMAGFQSFNGKLAFHPSCGSHAAVINSGQTAHRPNADDDFNFGVVLTNRPLKANEVFEVRLDRMVAKWAGSIEIGVTTHNPMELEFPSTMTNVRSGTWMMTGNGVMYNGTTVIDDYGHNLDKLKVGDRVAVVRKESGILHFFVNGEDQGPAANNIPENVYGVIDLYGQAAMASIIDSSPEISIPVSPESDGHVTSPTMYSQLDTPGIRFHHLHGRNAKISNNGLTASRPNALGEFNDAIVITNRPLKDGELFEIVIERLVERWSGSIEVGVTLIKPDVLEFPNTMTDIDYETWMLSGSSVMQDGQTVKNGYGCDLDTLPVGSRIGMQRFPDGSLHYIINGEDQGIACESIPANVFAVIDLYGQCAQVSIVPPISQTLPENSLVSSHALESSHMSILNLGSEVAHKLTVPICFGKRVELRNSNQSCSKLPDVVGGLVSLSGWLEKNESFEIRIDSICKKFVGSLRIGVTSKNIQELPEGVSFSSFKDFPSETLWIEDDKIILNGNVVKRNFCPDLSRLQVGDRLCLKRTSETSLRLFINGEEIGVMCNKFCEKVWPVVELYGATKAITVISTSSPPHNQNRSLSSITEVETHASQTDSSRWSKDPLLFHSKHGKNIVLKDNNARAVRIGSYNQGIVLSSRCLLEGEIFQVTLQKVSEKWTGSLSIGILAQSPASIQIPVSANAIKRNCVFVNDQGIYKDGKKVSCSLNMGQLIQGLNQGQSVGVGINEKKELHLYIDNIDQGIIVCDIQNPCHGIIDVYGRCEQVSIYSEVENTNSSLEKASNLSGLSNKDGKQQSNSILHILSPVRSPKRNCEYFKMCSRFKSSLGLPSEFFSHVEMPLCYCQHCNNLSSGGLGAVIKVGTPPMDLAIPFGWCKFPLKVTENGGVNLDDWHCAYHGTKRTWLRRILDESELVSNPSTEIGLEQRLILTKATRSKQEAEDADTPALIFSPSLKYLSSCELLCPPGNFKDKATKTTFSSARVAFQVKIQPGSYKIGPPSHSPSQGGAAVLDPLFKREEMEWISKERGNTVITHLLLLVQ